VRILSRRIPSSLEETQARLAALLHWPENLGMEMRRVTASGREGVLVFVQGLASQDDIHQYVLLPLQHQAGMPCSRERLHDLLPAPRLEVTEDLVAAVKRVMNGASTLFVDGCPWAAIVDTAGEAVNKAMTRAPRNPTRDVFGPDIWENIALVRKRLRDPSLMAVKADVRPGAEGAAALLYMDGRADPAVLDQVRRWTRENVGEDYLRKGKSSGGAGKWALVPEAQAVTWPDKAATLLSHGYVGLCLDHLSFVYVMPVTAGAILVSPGDDILRRPWTLTMRSLRVALAAIVTLGSGAVIAVYNYHPEMVPTPFLLAIAAMRENAAFPILAEVVLLEILQELIREATFRLPMNVSPGNAIIAGTILLGFWRAHCAVRTATSTGLCGWAACY